MGCHHQDQQDQPDAYVDKEIVGAQALQVAKVVVYHVLLEAGWLVLDYGLLINVQI